MYGYTKEFEVNEFIKLYLINSKTEIFVKDERFMQCKQAVLNIPLKPQQLSSIKTINDLIDRFKTKDDYHLEEFPYSLSPEEEFWVHCSNVQFWYENDYDTRWMDRNIAFPLLKILYEKGDPLANRVFFDEIIKNIETWNPYTILFLHRGESTLEYMGKTYIDYIPNSLFWELIKPNIIEKELESLKKLYSYRLTKMYNFDKIDEFQWLNKVPGFKTQDRHVVMIKYDDQYSLKFPMMILNFKELKVLKLSGNWIKDYPLSIHKLKKLVILDLSSNDIKEIPEDISHLKKLKVLNMRLNKLKSVPDSLSEMDVLEELNLAQNELEYFSVGIDSLKSINLSMNKLTKFPNEILNMEKLEILDLSHNQIRKVPSAIIKLKNLKELNLSFNNIKNSKEIKIKIEKLTLENHS